MIDEKVAVGVNEESSEKDESIPLIPNGESLTYKEIYAIAAKENSNYAVIIGNVGSGKTTLITTLYQMFFKGPVGQCFFAGSSTISAFEDRAFYTRLNSRAKKPETPRTMRGSLDSILHLRISRERKIINLFLSDFSGEDYEDSMANIEVARENLQNISTAKKIVLIIDGEKIVDSRLQRREEQMCTDIFQTTIDAGLLYSGSQVLIVLSKYDLIMEEEENREKLSRFIEGILPRFQEHFPDFAKEMFFAKIAAMPNNEKKVHFGYGMKDVLDFLINCNDLPDIPATNQVTLSQFDLWAERIPK